MYYVPSHYQNISFVPIIIICFLIFSESEIQGGKVIGEDGQTFDLRERLVSKFVEEP